MWDVTLCTPPIRRLSQQNFTRKTQKEKFSPGVAVFRDRFRLIQVKAARAGQGMADAAIETDLST
jgi:hypothetical protein